jgi:hypothetical protein
MKRSIAILVAVINVVVLIISSVALIMLQSAMSTTDSKLARQRELLDKVNDAMRESIVEFNFSNVHLTALSIDQSSRAAEANAGTAYDSHLMTLLTAAYDEEGENRADFEQVKNELQSVGARLTADFRGAFTDGAALHARIMRLVTENVARIQNRRDALEADRGAYSIWDTAVKVGVSALQFLSLLLLLMKEITTREPAGA